MNKIFWGLLFLMFDINIGSVSIIPDFIGYILIYLGMKEMGAEQTFSKAKPWMIASVIFAVVFWLPLWGEGIAVLAMLVGTVLHLTVTNYVVQGVDERANGDVDTAGLHKAWTVMAVCQVLSVLLIWLGWLAAIAAIVSFVAAIVFVVSFHGCKKQLEG